MKHARFLPLLLVLQAPIQALAQATAPVPATDNCAPLRQQIEARFRAGGVQPVLVVADAGSPPAGRVVGTCGNGRRQIVRLGQVPVPATAQATPATSPAPPTERPAEREPADKIPTECKDGSIVIGPNCDDPRAVRMTSAELAASLPPAKAAPGDQPAKPASR